MGNKFWNSEKLLSFSAILISVCTLIVFLYQTNLIKKQQYMSVLPYIQIANYGVGGINYKFVIRNDGIGPALLQSIKVTDKNGKTYNDLVDYVKANLTEQDSVDYYYANLRKGRLIPEKEIIEVIVLGDKKIESSKKLFDIIHADGLIMKIEYESIYGERWLISNKMSTPEKQ